MNSPSPKKSNRALIAKVLILILALVFLLGGTSALAQGSRPADRTGFLLGFGAGLSGAGYGYEINGETTKKEYHAGALGNLRFGYALSNSTAFTLELHGFGSYDHDAGHWGVGASFLAFTWWPGGGGFFVKVGAGTGGGEILRHDDGTLQKLDNKEAGLLTIGYEWRLGERFGLGLSAEGIGLNLDECPCAGDSNEHEGIGAVGAVVQFTWYL